MLAASVTLPLVVFFAMGAAMIGVPLLLGIATARNHPFVRAAKRHAKAILFANAVLLFALALCAVVFRPTNWWLMAGCWGLASLATVFQARQLTKHSGRPSPEAE